MMQPAPFSSTPWPFENEAEPWHLSSSNAADKDDMNLDLPSLTMELNPPDSLHPVSVTHFPLSPFSAPTATPLTLDANERMLTPSRAASIPVSPATAILTPSTEREEWSTLSSIPVTFAPSRTETVIRSRFPVNSASVSVAVAQAAIIASPTSNAWAPATPSQPNDAQSAKRAKHRAIDSKRRNLEAEAMTTLQQLVVDPASTSSSSAPIPKLSLLQACAEYIRQLQSQVQQLRLQASSAESESLSSSSSAERHSNSSDRKRKRTDPQTVLDEISHIEESHVLRNEMFMSAAVLLCCMDLTGRWIDVNQRWLQRMCWDRDEVIGRFGSPIAAYMPFITQHPDAQMTFPSNELVQIQGTCSKKFEYVQHDATTISRLRSLYQQKSQSIEFVDGFVMGGGKFIEIRWTCWLVLIDDRPQYFYLSAPDSAIIQIACTYQQAKQSTATPSMIAASAHTIPVAVCTCSQGGAGSCAHCNSDGGSCSPSSCKSVSSPSSSADSSVGNCNCAGPRRTCSTTVPCGCAH